MDKFSRGFNFAIDRNFWFCVDLISRLRPSRKISRGFNFADKRKRVKLKRAHSIPKLLIVTRLKLKNFTLSRKMKKSWARFYWRRNQHPHREKALPEIKQREKVRKPLIPHNWKSYVVKTKTAKTAKFYPREILST